MGKFLTPKTNQKRGQVATWRVADWLIVSLECGPKLWMATDLHEDTSQVMSIPN